MDKKTKAMLDEMRQMFKEFVREHKKLQKEYEKQSTELQLKSQALIQIYEHRYKELKESNRI
jgi:hypothetical protein